mmetsp:Transcript_42107/g.132951  ORF Transcript_42107/g.132951 Transcript_42107/m.132951 type:complete len:240 (-) Transcript_42107:844-1563(-)
MDLDAVDRALHALAFEQLEGGALGGRRHLEGLCKLDEGGGDGVARHRLDGRGEAHHPLGAARAVGERHLHQPEASFGDGARLVEGERAQLREELHLARRLDEDSPAREGGDSARVGDRHRDDERARARDHHERDRAVQPPLAVGGALEPLIPAAPAQRHRREEQRAEHDGEGVHLGEALEQLLALAALRLRLGHELRQLRRRRLRRQRVHLHLEHARLVGRARNDGGAGLLHERHRLAG